MATPGRRRALAREIAGGKKHGCAIVAPVNKRNGARSCAMLFYLGNF
jgi:hypothetical protein